MLLALLWHTEYWSLCLPKAVPESRAGAPGGMESVLGCMGFAGLYPAAPEPGYRLKSAAHLVRDWAPLGLNSGKSRHISVKHVEGNLQVSASRFQSLRGKKIYTDSALLMLIGNPLSFTLLLWESPHKMRNAEFLQWMERVGSFNEDIYG